ncbi:hypothetical protein T484DRAFT_1794834 [Baffinella frigidus]|nr:hypothetical protein T484DRAFT_1794834 [Cryptophyta sp. CCMP2293]
MSYRPHKRKKATTLEGKCVERIVKDFRDIFRPGILSVALRTKVLELLCDDPILVSLPEGFLDEEWTEISLGGCVIPEGILAMIGREVRQLETMNLKQCSGHEMIQVQGFAALCDGCRQLKTMDLVGVTTLTDAHLACMYPLGSSLRQVRLAGCIMLTPEALALFIKKAGRNLLELDLAGCQITDIVLEAIAASQHAMALFFRSIKKVKILKLPWVHMVGKAMVLLLAVHMMGKAMVLLLARHLGDQLVELDLAGCVDIGVEEMMYLASHCKQLKKINLK